MATTRSGRTYGQASMWFGALVAINMLIMAAFWLVRVFAINGSDTPQLKRVGQGDEPAPVEMWSDSLYHSAMTQSTVGSSDLVPATPLMRIITGAQSACTLIALVWMLQF